MKVTRYKVDFETGPTTADCHTVYVNSNTIESAKRIVESRYKYVMFTSVEKVKDSTMEPKYMTAQEARDAMQSARSLQGEYKKAETEKILESIQAAAKKGNDSVQTGSIDPVVKTRLEILGYKVKWVEGYDQRDPGYTEIKW
jgi:hypothetical protein